MSTPPVVPLLAGVISGAFAVAVATAFAQRRRPHQAAWGLGLALYSFASFAEAAGGWGHWSVPLYRVYYPAIAGAVGFLGVGTVFLLRRPKSAWTFAALVALGVAFVALSQFALPVDGKVFAQGSDVGAMAYPKPASAPYAGLVLLQITGGLALIFGALASWRATRARGVLLIAIGACLPFAAGSLEGLGLPGARVIAQLLGIIVMYAGYHTARESSPRTPNPAAAAQG